MPTLSRQEERFLLVLLGLFIVGSGVWYVRRTAASGERMDWRRQQQRLQTAFQAPAAKAGTPKPAPPPAMVTGKQRAISNKININSASAKELERLPRVGPVMAQRILSFRNEHGPFHSVEDLKQIKGIGEKTLARIRDRVTID